jgi:hypothetical protein
MNVLAIRRTAITLPLLYLAAMFLLNGCATVPPKLAYPALKAGEAACVLRLENTFPSWNPLGWPISMEITVDGFLPVEKRPYLQKGITEVRLPAGNHVLVQQARQGHNTIYYFKPVTMSFDVEAGKTYTIRFKNTSTAVICRYGVEYEGWSTEQCSQWPNTVSVANHLFGR